VALMYAGQIIEMATAKEFFSNPKHPYAQALLRALPDSNRRGESLQAIPGTVPPLTQTFTGCRFAPRCAQVMPECATTVPELWPQPDSIDRMSPRSVRCLLYKPGVVPPPRFDIHAVPAGQIGVPKVKVEPLAGVTPGAPLLDVTNLRVRFPIRKGILQRVKGSFDAVDGISFSLVQGRTLALVGESGCGKTTTGKAIVQLLRDAAQIEGQALLHGRNLFTLNGDDLIAARGDIQIIFQDPFASLNPRMRVADILEEGLLALQRSMDAAARRQRIEQLTDQVGLRKDALGRYPHEFSGGQRQRIAIARALAVEPKLIICDEPTSALDVSVQAQILNLLRDLQSRLGVSYLFITHNIGVVEYIADEVAVMQAGKIVEQGKAQQVLSAPQNAYTKRLIDSVPRLVAGSV
jgi:peptide/nickel transport system ATP-binding protein